MDALLDEGALSDNGLLGAGSNDPLDRQLQQLSAQQNVDAQLQAMKQQMQLGGPTHNDKSKGQPPNRETSPFSSLYPDPSALYNTTSASGDGSVSTYAA